MRSYHTQVSKGYTAQFSLSGGSVVNLQGQYMSAFHAAPYCCDVHLRRCHWLLLRSFSKRSHFIILSDSFICVAEYRTKPLSFSTTTGSTIVTLTTQSFCIQVCTRRWLPWCWTHCAKPSSVPPLHLTKAKALRLTTYLTLKWSSGKNYTFWYWKLQHWDTVHVRIVKCSNMAPCWNFDQSYYQFHHECNFFFFVD